jgi:hypothetical protein
MGGGDGYMKLLYVPLGEDAGWNRYIMLLFDYGDFTE